MKGKDTIGYPYKGYPPKTRPDHDTGFRVPGSPRQSGSRFPVPNFSNISLVALNWLNLRKSSTPPKRRKRVFPDFLEPSMSKGDLI